MLHWFLSNRYWSWLRNVNHIISSLITLAWPRIRSNRQNPKALLHNQAICSTASKAWKPNHRLKGHLGRNICIAHGHAKLWMNQWHILITRLTARAYWLGAPVSHFKNRTHQLLWVSILVLPDIVILAESLRFENPQCPFAEKQFSCSGAETLARKISCLSVSSCETSFKARATD